MGKRGECRTSCMMTRNEMHRCSGRCEEVPPRFVAIYMNIYVRFFREARSKELIRPCTQIAYLCMRSPVAARVEIKIPRPSAQLVAFCTIAWTCMPFASTAAGREGKQKRARKNINKPKNKIKHNIPIAILHKCMPSRVENRFQLGPEPKEQSESACDSNCGMLKAVAVCWRSRREKSSRTCMMRRLIGFRNACGLLIFD